MSVSPTAVNWTVTAGEVPSTTSIRVTTPGGGWSTFDTSPFYDATAACASGTCASGSSTTLTPNATHIRGLAPGTYLSPLTIRSAGVPDVIVPVTLVIRAATTPPPAEVCGDGRDNDGDGQIDENCTTGGQVPGPPRRLARNVEGSTVYLWWRAPISGGTPTGYLVEAGVVPGTPIFRISTGLLPVVQVRNVGTGRYYVRVRAVNAAGTSEPSNEVTVSVGCNSRPRQSSLSSTTNGDLVSFSWVDPDGCNDTSTRLDVGSAPGTTNVAQAQAAGDSLTASAPPGTYFARVVTVSPFGESAPSNEVSVIVGGGACAPPSFATDLNVQMTGRQVTLTWSPANEAAAIAADDIAQISYVLEVGTAAGLANLGSFNMGRATAFTTVAPPGLYYVRVRVADMCGLGEASNEFVVDVR
jgi:hypothetical protein